MRVLIAPVFVIMILSSFLWAEDQVTPQSKEINRVTMHSIMHDIFYSIASLRPYMVSEEKFLDPKNAPAIEMELESLKNKVKKASHEPMLQSPNFRISRQVLEEHVAETQRVFKLGNKNYARWSLNSTMSICMSCHSQMPSKNSSRGGLILEESGTFVKSFDRAEWLFVARNFDKALEIYNNSIRSYPANKVNVEQVEASLERKIAIYARVKRDFKGAIIDLEKDLKNNDLPPYLRENIHSWIKSLKKYQTEKLPNPLTASSVEIKNFATKNLKADDSVIGENPRAAKYLIVSGILYEYLNQHPTSEMTPELLFWLAQCDRNTNNNFFYSLADIYLKQCILNYPSHPIAKDCYKDYELYTIASYSGSSGTHIPVQVSRELNILKKLVENPPELQRKK